MFLGLHVLLSFARVTPLAGEVIRLTTMALAIAIFSRRVVDLSLRSPVISIAIGVLVFVLWITPDLLWPGYRRHLENAITGAVKSSLPLAALSSGLVLALRSLRAVMIVPIFEELFWRGWLMRWIISPDFQKIPLGAYTPLSFWIVAVLFASEHGPYWDVGLAAGIVYNWWMIRTRSLGDVMLAHAVTNACLSAYVIATGKWEYWL